MNFIPIALALFSLVPQGLQGIKTAEVPSASASAEKVAFDGIGKALQAAVQDGSVVGHSALIFQDGEVLYADQFGHRDLAAKLPMERDTIFRIYSMTKPITSVAAMQLVEAGKIKLDEPVATYLPEFADLKVLRRGKLIEARRAMTVRDLMRHTSGLTYGFFGTSAVDKMYVEKGVLRTDKNLKAMVQKLSTLPLKSHPRLRFHYSVSTDVLARVIEVASGEEFSDYLKKHIFDPLGMRDTFFTVPKDKLHRFAEMYKPTENGLVPSPKLASYRFLNETGLHSGGGGLCSTIDDYLQFSRVLIQKGSHGDHQILKPESLDQMFINQLEEVKYSADWFQFGLGFHIDPKLGDYSWGGMAGTSFWVNPKRKLAILYMVQINPRDENHMPDRLRQMTYDLLDKQ